MLVETRATQHHCDDECRSDEIWKLVTGMTSRRESISTASVKPSPRHPFPRPKIRN
jgi:hypothetical protein